MQAKEAHNKNLRETNEILGKIMLKVKSDLYKNWDKDLQPTWADAGTSGRTLELTKELAEWLNIEEA